MMVLACITYLSRFMGYRESCISKESTWKSGSYNSQRIDCVEGPDKFETERGMLFDRVFYNFAIDAMILGGSRVHPSYYNVVLLLRESP